MSLALRARQHVLLPAHVIRKLPWQLRQSSRLAITLCRVQDAQLVHEDFQRPEVEHDMMGHQQQERLFRRASHEFHTEQWACLQVKRPVDLREHVFANRLFTPGGDVLLMKSNLHQLVCLLSWGSIDGAESSSQRRMANCPCLQCTA